MKHDHHHDFAEKNYNRRDNKIWGWITAIAFILTMLMFFAKLDVVLFAT